MDKCDRCSKGQLINTRQIHAAHPDLCNKNFTFKCESLRDNKDICRYVKGKHMRAIKQARRLIEKNPRDPESIVLANLVASLESELPFSLQDLYKLDEKHFELAIAILGDWRLDRFYIGKAKIFDVALEVMGLQQAPSKKSE